MSNDNERSELKSSMRNDRVEFDAAVVSIHMEDGAERGYVDTSRVSEGPLKAGEAQNSAGEVNRVTDYSMDVESMPSGLREDQDVYLGRKEGYGHDGNKTVTPAQESVGAANPAPTGHMEDQEVVLGNKEGHRHDGNKTVSPLWLQKFNEARGK